ncbi:MAG: acetyl-CoA carboxylase, carboxyltransferase subunit beta [Bacteroidota bacterium]|nr:acetyl-CoA carboxylase, carboxyltransferase subunit beta [Bacteroidota bacterium]MDW8137555.1 acetyl-CoA carboxylase, carboxyltransferase subunit beta [Bacteroidota bacterium]
MTWYKRTESGIQSTTRRDVPVGLWIKCEGCGEIFHRSQWRAQAYTCPQCQHHQQIGSEEYFELLFDEGSGEEFNGHLRPVDRLQFVDRKPYAQRLLEAQRETGLLEAVRTATGLIHGRPAIIACMDFAFIGGSMGSVVGEKIGRAIDRAREERTPLIVISQSGGARMMESALSLMQMAKTSAKLARLAEARVPYFSVLTHPTTGGVTASYAMLGDVNIAEPGALIGFAGPRVIKQTIGSELPKGFQRAEFLLEHGFVDLIVHRKQLKQTLAHLIDLFLG